MADSPQGVYIQSITCEINSTTGIPYWMGEENLMSCIPINCDPPPAILNAYISNIKLSSTETNLSLGNSSNYFINTQVNYSCLTSYRFQHSGELTAMLRCNTVSLLSHIAQWNPVNISCPRISHNFLFVLSPNSKLRNKKIIHN